MTHQSSRYSRYFYSGKDYNILKNNKKNILRHNKKNSKFKKIIGIIMRIFIFSIITFAVLFFTTRLLFVSKIFKIKVTIGSLEKQESYYKISEIVSYQKDQPKLFWKEDNIFLFNKKEFAENLSEKSNDYFYDIKIKKELPNKINIEVKERSPKIVIITNKNKYYLDENGNILSTTKIDSNTNNVGYGEKNEVNKNVELPILYIDEDVDLINNPLSKENVIFIMGVFKKLPKYNINIDKLKLQIADDNKIIAYEKRGFEIYFNLLKDVDEQIDYLNIVIKEEIKNKISGISYIDLRFIPKIFYK